MGEFEIIAKYFTRASRDGDVLLGVGDDAAVLKVPPEQRLVVSVDTISEGVHFPVGTRAVDIGYRALAVNLSDIAAMGATPKWFTLALSIPQNDSQWLQDFSSGLFELAEALGVTLVGGDTVRGPLVITLQIFGCVEADRWLTRAAAQPGDVIFVSGVPGEAAAGLAIIQRNLKFSGAADNAAAEYLLQRFLRPTPRVELGRLLRTCASAALDVSDGTLADLKQLCTASRCGARIDIEALPVSSAMQNLFSAAEREQFALAGGDDYELLFTVPQARLPEVESLTASLLVEGVSCTSIGRIAEGNQVQCFKDGKLFPVTRTGYAHF